MRSAIGSWAQGGGSGAGRAREAEERREAEGVKRTWVADDYGASRIQAEQAIEELGQRRIVWRADGMLFGLGLPQDVVASRKKQLWHMIWPGLSEIN